MVSRTSSSTHSCTRADRSERMTSHRDCTDYARIQRSRGTTRSPPFSSPSSAPNSQSLSLSLSIIDLRRMFSSPPPKHFRSFLFRPKRSPPPYGPFIRHPFSLSQTFLRFCPLPNLSPNRYRQRWLTLL